MCKCKGLGKVIKVFMKIYIVGYFVECIGLDIMFGLLRSIFGNKYILVIGDYFMKWVDVYFIKDMEVKIVVKIYMFFGGF